MLKKFVEIISLCLTLGMVNPLLCQTQEWVWTYNGPGDKGDRFNSIAYGTDGNIYASGYTEKHYPDSPGDFIIVKFSPAGDTQWSYRYPYTGAGYYQSKVIWGSDGNIYAGSESYVISLTPDKTERWVYTKAAGFGKSIVYGNDGYLYFCGDSITSLTTTGGRRWSYYWAGSKMDIAYGPDGNVYVAGAIDGKFTVLSLTSGGVWRWTYSYNGPVNDDLAYSVAIDNTGNIYAAGKIRTSHYFDVFVASLTPTGNERWTHTYSAPGDGADYALDITVGTDGNLYLTGKGGYPSSDGDIIVLSLTPNGERRWLYYYNGPGGYWDCAYGIVYGLDGNVYLAGESYGLGTHNDVATISLTRFGNKRWVSRYNGTFNDEEEAWALVYGSDGKLYVCGATYRNSPTFNSDLLLIKYDPGSTGVSNISTNPSPLIFRYDNWVFQNQKYATKFRIPTAPLLEETLSDKMLQARNNEFLPVIILLSEQVDAQALAVDAAGIDKKGRRNWVVAQLKTLSQTSQKDIITFLKTRETQGKVRNISSLWILNAIGAEMTKDVINEISSIPGIFQISYDGDYFHISETSAPADNTSSPRALAWHVQKIQADQVWAQGYTGKGIIVGVLDTGVRWSHTDLQDHMWNGGTLYPFHGWNFVSDNNSPADDNGHGTHVAGIVAGDGTSGTQTGIAPDAQIMAIKVLNSSGAGSIITIARGVQFAIEHNADIINMSLGADSAKNSTKQYCRDMCLMAYIAGVSIAVAAGNGRSGSPGSHYPVPYDISTPGDVPSPWYAPNGGNNAAITVGATDEFDVIANFSSYGPTQWNTSIYADYPYPPGLQKPDVSAPGVNITSLDYLNPTGYTIKSGTSMATPCLAGTIALMLEKNRFLTCQEIDSIIQTTSLDLGVAGRDNYYGAGRINALNAVNAVAATIAVKGIFYIKNAASATGNLEFDKKFTWSKSWIKEASTTLFNLVPGESTAVNVYVDTTGLPNNATLYDTIWIYSNDPDIGLYPEPVWLVRGIIGIEEPSFPEANTPVEDQSTGIRISPNPFRNDVHIRCRMHDTGYMIKIYDVSGRVVKSFNLESCIMNHESNIVWAGDDDMGDNLPAGVYFVVPDDNSVSPVRVVKIK